MKKQFALPLHHCTGLAQNLHLRLFSIETDALGKFRCANPEMQLDLGSMSEKKHITSASIRQIAHQLSMELGGFQETGLSENEDTLSQRHRTLIADSFGLLNGLSDGTVTKGQPRVRDNLLQVISELPEGEAAKEICLTLRTVVSRAASCGLTAESQQVNNLRMRDVGR